MTDDSAVQTIRQLAKPDSRFFLKSEYGPFSNGWPVLAFSSPRLGTMLRRDFRTGTDFVVVTGTTGSETVRSRTPWKAALANQHKQDQNLQHERTGRAGAMEMGRQIPSGTMDVMFPRRRMGPD